MFEKVVETVERAYRGETIDVHLSDDPYEGSRSNLGRIVSFGPQRYILVTGPPGNGKTAFTDTNFVLKPYLYYKKHGGLDVNWIYRSMERQTTEKIAKWTCALMYYDHGIIMSPSTLFQRGNAERALTEDDIKLFKGYQPFFEEMFKRVDLVDGSDTPENVLKYAEKAALSRGVKFTTEGDFLFAHTNKGKQQVGEFIESDIIGGVDRKYMDLSYGRIWQDKVYYFKHDDSLFVHIVDHIGKIGDGLKSTVDSHSKNMADTLRDLYGWGVIDILQMNRDFEDAYRQKNQKIQVKQSDIKGSNNPVENADTILGILNLRKYDVSSYDGYQINKMMAEGAPMFRLLFGVKNSWGTDPFFQGIYFVGENGWTKELPPPPLSEEIYQLIQRKAYV